MRARLACLLMLTGFACSCSCKDDPGESGTQPEDSAAPGDSQQPGDTQDTGEPWEYVDALTSATPNVEEVQLGKEHSGWADAYCMDCHDTLHANDFGDSTCAACHGSNGAPLRAAGHDDAGCRADRRPLHRG